MSVVCEELKIDASSQGSLLEECHGVSQSKRNVSNARELCSRRSHGWILGRLRHHPVRQHHTATGHRTIEPEDVWPMLTRRAQTTAEHDAVATIGDQH